MVAECAKESKNLAHATFRGRPWQNRGLWHFKKIYWSRTLSFVHLLANILKIWVWNVLTALSVLTKNIDSILYYKFYTFQKKLELLGGVNIIFDIEITLPVKNIRSGQDKKAPKGALASVQ